MPKSFSIDLKQLETNYKKLQQKHHPDQYATKSKQEQAEAELASSSINQAYATLRKPLERARYMLKHEGIEEDEGEIITDPGLLMEIMEIQEQIAETDDQASLAHLLEGSTRQYDEIVNDIVDAFEKGDLDKVKDKVSMLSYYTTLVSNIQTKMSVE
eukprot:CAMPEP_0167798196 /NCGR_PEP_ID=MMETSP0111_2-20121227/16156_1 /TAXON_ID=91324 /ORGANISM="Lotharella globosa, Strain CCCM811" /LENGTH=156 /DNA_ID=CAMNT_0007692547 /DNA_START=74 /DNA_END=541 /DNA_ORIENTATION=-